MYFAFTGQGPRCASQVQQYHLVILFQSTFDLHFSVTRKGNNFLEKKYCLKVETGLKNLNQN